LGTVTTVRDTTIGLVLAVEATWLDGVGSDVGIDDVVTADVTACDVTEVVVLDVGVVEFSQDALTGVGVLLERGAVTMAVLYCIVA
jgi:hypothetical protein